MYQALDENYIGFAQFCCNHIEHQSFPNLRGVRRPLDIFTSNVSDDPKGFKRRTRNFHWITFRRFCQNSETSYKYLPKLKLFSGLAHAMKSSSESNHPWQYVCFDNRAQLYSSTAILMSILTARRQHSLPDHVSRIALLMQVASETDRF